MNEAKLRKEFEEFVDDSDNWYDEEHPRWDEFFDWFLTHLKAQEEAKREEE
jgi:hypothetical protein